MKMFWEGLLSAPIVGVQGTVPDRGRARSAANPNPVDEVECAPRPDTDVVENVEPTAAIMEVVIPIATGEGDGDVDGEDDEGYTALTQTLEDHTNS